MNFFLQVACASAQPKWRLHQSLVVETLEQANDWRNGVRTSTRDRNSLSAAELSADQLKNDRDSAASFLAQMFASGAFQDDPACH